MAERRPEEEEIFDFAALLAQEEAEAAPTLPVEEQGQPAEQEQLSLAASMFEKLKSIFTRQQQVQSAMEAEAPVETEQQEVVEEEEPLSDILKFEDTSTEMVEEPAVPVTDEEIAAAVSTVIEAIREGSEATGVELSDQRALEIALSVLAQATSLEQAELLIYGMLTKEAQRQGVGVKRQQPREFEGNTEDTLDMFIRLATS